MAAREKTKLPVKAHDAKRFHSNPVNMNLIAMATWSSALDSYQLSWYDHRDGELYYTLQYDSYIYNSMRVFK